MNPKAAKEEAEGGDLVHQAGERRLLIGAGAGGQKAMRPLRVLVACEYSGRVREAFRKLGHNAWSCDLLPAEDESWFHFQQSITGPGSVLFDGWDLMIAHPPCTHLAVSGARHFAAKESSGVQSEALEFVQLLLDAPIKYIALENPVSIISTRIRKPNQIIQPWQFGHGETKTTCLWLKNLPKLAPTNIVAGRADRIHKMPPSPTRWKERSRTYQGIADAMADQWSRWIDAQMNAHESAGLTSTAPVSR